MYHLYADGSAITSPKRGGWGYVILDGDFEIIGHGYEDNRGTNRMELLAVIKGLNTLPLGSDVIVYTDSLFVMNGRFSPIKPHKDISELWLKLREHCRTMTVKFKKVGSGNPSPIHRRAHHLAREAVFNGVSSDYLPARCSA